MTAKVEYVGADRLKRTTAVAAARFAIGFTGTERAIGTRGADLARAAAPRRTGALASTIAADGASFGAGTAYAGPLEFGVGPRPGRRGGHNIRARRYLRGAAQRVTPFALAQVAQQTHRIVTSIEGA